MIAPELRCTFDGIEREDTIVATYAVEVDRDGDILAKLSQLARFVYPGTGTDVAGMLPERWEWHAARIMGIYESPQHEVGIPTAAQTRQFVVQMALPADIVGDSLAMLLAFVAGEAQAYGHTRLLDLFLPRSYVDLYRGPRFGIGGIRELLGVPDRPLLLAIYKPSQGYSPEEGAAMFYEVAAGGVDILKDDELLSDPVFCRRAERVRLYTQARQRVFEETGHTTLYAVNITDRPDRLLANALEAIELGANALMLSYVQVGLDAARMVCEDSRVTVPVLGHNSGATSLYASPDNGMSSTLINAKLPRLCGLDLGIFFNEHGKFPMLRERGILIAREMVSPFHTLRPMLPIAAGGATPGLVGVVCAEYGLDIAVGAGGAIFGHPQGPRAGAMAFRQAIDCVVELRDVKEAASEHPELDAALKLWGAAG